MNAFLKTIAACISGGFVVALINHYLAKRRERRRDQVVREHAAATTKEEEKRVFRAAITSLRDTVVAAKDRDLVEAHNQSLPRFRDECAKIEPEIPDAGDFRTTRDAYRSLTGPDIECRDATQKPPPSKDQFGNYRAGSIAWKPPCRYKLGRQRIKELLDRMCEHAK